MDTNDSRIENLIKENPGLALAVSEKTPEELNTTIETLTNYIAALKEPGTAENIEKYSEDIAVMQAYSKDIASVYPLIDEYLTEYQDRQNSLVQSYKESKLPTIIAKHDKLVEKYEDRGSSRYKSQSLNRRLTRMEGKINELKKQIEIKDVPKDEKYAKAIDKLDKLQAAYGNKQCIAAVTPWSLRSNMRDPKNISIDGSLGLLKPLETRYDFKKDFEEKVTGFKTSVISTSMQVEGKLPKQPTDEIEMLGLPSFSPTNPARLETELYNLKNISRAVKDNPEEFKEIMDKMNQNADISVKQPQQEAKTSDTIVM